MTAITLLLDGEAIPVTNLFDEDGDEVTEWEEAFTFVAGPLPDGTWLSALTGDHRKAVLA